MGATTTTATSTARRAGRLGAALLLLGALLSLVLPALTPAPADAAPAPAAGGTLTWQVSKYAWETGGSLAAVHEAEAPAVVGADGFAFSQGGGTYDPATGAASIHYGGALILGNTSFGNFRIKLANPHLVLTGSGSGTLAVDLSICESPCLTGTYTTPTPGVVAAQLSDVTLGGTAQHRTATATPDWILIPGDNPNGLRQFPQPFLDALPVSMQGFFKQTGTSGTNPDKGPAPISFAFDPVVASTSSSTSTSTSTTTSTSTSSTTSSTISSTSSTSSTVASDGEAIEAGTLDWGVKGSFRAYVTSPVAAGAVSTGSGATSNADGSYRFPLDSGTYRDADDLDARFEGSVRFTGHDGALDLTFSDPRVAIDGSHGTLTVDATDGDQAHPGVLLADLDLAGVAAARDGDQLVLAGVPATLTAQGAPTFGGFYQAGDALDPLTLRLAIDDADDLPPATSTTAGGTSTTAAGAVGCLDRASVAAGGSIAVCGDGFLAGEQVQVFLHSDPLFVTVLTADASGRASATVTIPAAAPSGSHRLELRGVSSGRSLMSSPITVTAAGGSGLPRTGAAPLELARWALLLVGVGLLAMGRVQQRRA